MFLDTRPSALPYPRPWILGPSALGPHLVAPRPLKYCQNKFMNKTYYLLKIILIQDIQKAIQKGQAMASKINGKDFHRNSFFSLITKETEKDFMLKYIQ